MTKINRFIAAALIVAVGLISFFVAAPWASSSETHAETIAAIDEKTETVLKLTATSTIASAGISAIPGDTATPISEKLADFTEYFLLILTVLYSEKYLLTIIGAGVFRIVIPGACLLAVAGLFYRPELLKKLAFKLAVFGLALFVAIPLSIEVSDMIYSSYESSIEQTIAETESFTEKTDALEDTDKTDTGLIASILGRFSETADSLQNKAADILKRFVETLAVLIVTSCVIPILVLLFFIWLFKMLTGFDISVPYPLRRHGKAKAEPENAE